MKEMRHGIEVDRPEHAFAADLLVEQDGEAEADGRADHDIEAGEDGEILQRDPPVRQRPEPHVVLPADEIEARQDLGIGEGQIAREDDEAVDEDEDRREAGRQHDARQEFAEPLPGRPCRLGDRGAAL